MFQSSRHATIKMYQRAKNDAGQMKHTDRQGPYTSGHLKFKAIQDFKLFEKEIQNGFNAICTFKPN